MTAPNVSIRKQDGNLGSVKPTSTGVLAIIAACQTGALNQAASFSRQDLALASRGVGPLTECAAYVMAQSKKPTLGIRATASVAGAYSTVTTSKTGTFTPVAGASVPLDEYVPSVRFVAGGALGTPGITYQDSLDGVSWSAVKALGSALAITISMPASAGGGSSGVGFTLGSAAQTVVAGDSFTCFTTRPMPSNTDISTALEALRVSRLPWEGVLVDADIGTGTIAVVDTWLSAREGEGVFRFAILGTRKKNQPAPATEDEATYIAAMTTLTASQASIRCMVGVDGGDCASAISGLITPRSAALALAGRLMGSTVGTDPARVLDGPIVPFQIADGAGNPKWHDEDLYPGLDDQRLSSLRSFPPGADAPGVYITNGRVLSSGSSDYQFAQHIRTMNTSCEIAYRVLANQLSIGVRKKAPEAVTGLVFIAEDDAQRIEGLVTDAVNTELKGEIQGFRFVLSRTDDLSSNSGATVHGSNELADFAYIKNFAVVAKFVKSI